MCGRITLSASAAEIAAGFALEVESLRERDGGDLRPRFNVAPSQDLLTVTLDAAGGRRVGWRRWGLVPAWAEDPSIGARLFNARSETVAEKPSFRAAFRSRRCVVVADGFYEWTSRARDHRPHHLRARDGSLLGLAGLHELWQGPDGAKVESCTVLTTEANRDVAWIHPRMPVILDDRGVEAWLEPGSDVERLSAWLAPAAEGLLESRPVSRRVNDPRRDDVECLAVDRGVEQQPGLFP